VLTEMPSALKLEFRELLFRPFAAMPEVLFSWLVWFRVYFQNSADLQLIIVALRHQITVQQRKSPKAD
jgi:hypothetical protein